jgi:hypothetical protein
MTEFYALPNDVHFWHWPTLIHFFLVAMAGGAAVVTTVAHFTKHPKARTYAFVTMVLIVLDLATLWIESPARFRFTHVWIFLTITPTAPIWLGGWGLAISLVGSFFVWLQRGPRLLWGAILIVGSSLAMIYPGLALAANINRPLWTPVVLILFPLTGMLTVISIAHLLKQDWAKRWIAPLSLASVAMGVVYLAGLMMGGTESRMAFDYLMGHGGLLFALGLALMAVVPVIRRIPVVTALVPLAGATIVRSLIVEVGQIQFFGF